MNFPTLLDACDRLILRARQSRGSTRETYSSIGYKLRIRIDAFGNAANSKRDIEWKTLSGQNWALCTAGCSLADQALLSSVHLGKEFTYRQCNNLLGSGLKQLFIIEECQDLFPEQTTRKNSLLMDYFRQSRSYELALIFISQSPDIDHTVMQNCALQLEVGGFGDARSYAKFASSVGLNRVQLEKFYTMKSPGSAIIRDIRAPWPFSVQLFKPELPTKSFTPKEIESISERSEEILLSKCPPETHDSSHVAGSKGTAKILQDNVQASANQFAPRKREPHIACSKSRRSDKALLNGRRLMMVQLQHEASPYLYRGEAASVAGITGGASITNAERALLNEKEISIDSLPCGKTVKRLWRILDKGYNALRIPCKIVGLGKGGYSHEFSVGRLMYQHQLQGDYTEIEHRRQCNGKLVDLMVRSDDRILYYEVCASWPVVDKEISNLQLDTVGSPLPDKVIFVVTERKMIRPLQKAVISFIATKHLHIPVTVELAGNLIIPLRIRK